MRGGWQSEETLMQAALWKWGVGVRALYKYPVLISSANRAGSPCQVIRPWSST
jgi:hypothetical protein